MQKIEYKRMLKCMKNLPVLLVMAGSLSLTGCVKDYVTDLHEPGTDIIFGASNMISTDVDTRTEYSGKDQNDHEISSSSTYERIDWVADQDIIRILCDAASGKSTPSKKTADYVICDVSMNPDDNKKSQASITSCDDNSLQWGTGQHYFYALYPAPGTVSNYSFSSYRTVTESNSKIESVATNKAKITGVVPATQEAVKSGDIYKPNMNYAYMYAATRFDVNSSGNVLLSFEPLVTTLEFSLSKTTTGLESNLTQLELSSTSTPLTGTFSAAIDVTSGTPSVGITAPGYNSSNNKITITLPSSGIALSNTPIQITFITLPVDQKDLKLTLTFANGNQRTLLLKHLNSNKVTAMRKAYFDLTVPGTIPYTLEVQGPSAAVSEYGGSATYQVRSYKQGNSGNEAVGWDVDSYQVDGGSWQSGKPAWLTSLITTSSGSTGYTSFTADLAENTKTKAKSWEGSTAVAGGEYSPVNLGVTNAQLNTSNCYIVSQPGWYCIPIIYGNGYSNGNVGNTSSFTSSAPNGLSRFHNYAGNGINDPWLQNDGVFDLNDYTNLSVQLLWEDRNGLIDPSKFDTFNEYLNQEQLDASCPENIKSHNQKYFNGGVRGYSYAGRYFRFYVDPAHIGQGNAVIAVKNGSTIVWSWHIWVIESSRIGTRKVNGVDMMALNLGWVDSDQVPASRTVKVRVKQRVSGNTAEFTITQSGKTYPNGSNVYYQWGRKDPMLGWNESYTAPRQQWGNGQWVIFSGQASLADGIQNPNRFYAGNWQWTSQTFHNLWNTTSGGTNTNSTVTKTVYDPCPPGFKVPNRNVFVGISFGDVVGTYDYGFRIKTSNSGSQEAFFPGTYLREATTGTLEDYRRDCGYIWTASLQNFFEYTTAPLIRLATDQATAYGFSVRCVKE